MIMIEDKQLLIEHMAWNMVLQREKINVLSFYFNNSDILDSTKKPITKVAVSQALVFLDSIPTLQPIWFGSPIDKTGGIMFVSSQEKDGLPNPDTVIITERGTALLAKADVDKYIKYHKL